jgi:hypothetical protein
MHQVLNKHACKEQFSHMNTFSMSSSAPCKYSDCFIKQTVSDVAKDALRVAKHSKLEERTTTHLHVFL